MAGTKRLIKGLPVRTKLFVGLFLFISFLAAISIFIITYTTQGIWEMAIGLLLANLILGVITTLALSRLILTPVSRLAEGIYKMHKGDLSATHTIDTGFIKCWEKLNCNSKECPAYGKENQRCWVIAGTYCLGQIQGVYAQKMGDCRKCIVYKYNCGDELSQLDDAFKISVRNLFATIADLEKAKKDAEAYSNELELSHKTVKELHKYTNNILNSLSTGIIALDEDRKIKFFNNSAKNILGIDLKNIIGKSFEDVIYKHPDCINFFEFVKNKTTEFEKKGRILDNIEKGFILNGQEVILSLKLMPLYGVKYAKSVPLIIVFDNITEQKRLYLEYEQSKKMAELGIVAAKISHEVRNPLHVIEGGLHYLTKEYINDKKIAEIIELLRDQVIRLDKVTADLLEVAKPIKGKIEKTNLKDIVLKTLKFMKGSLIDADINLQVELDEGLPDIWAYPTELERALVNIIRNSIDASQPGGRIKVGTSLINLKEKALVEVIVTDNGKGIHDKASIFKPFYTTKPNGTGLGMSIVQKIVNQHKGDIVVEDNPEGAGTIVSIRLPLEGTLDHAEYNINN